VESRVDADSFQDGNLYVHPSLEPTEDRMRYLDGSTCHLSMRGLDPTVEEVWVSYVSESPSNLEYIVVNSAQILPLYVLHFDNRPADSELSMSLGFRLGQSANFEGSPTGYARKHVPTGFGAASGRLSWRLLRRSKMTRSLGATTNTTVLTKMGSFSRSGGCTNGRIVGHDPQAGYPEHCIVAVIAVDSALAKSGTIFFIR